MSKNLLVRVKTTVFILAGLTILVSFLVVISNHQSVFSFSSKYKLVLNDAEGLFKGTPVTINGMKVGRIQNVGLEEDQIIVLLSIKSKYASMINQSAIAELKTEGFLGDKYINISSTDFSQPPLEPGSSLSLKSENSLKNLLSKENNIITVVTQFFEEGHKLLVHLNKEENEENFGMALKDISVQLQKFLSDDKNKDVKDILKHTKSILRKVDKGQGTLGAIVNDRSLHNQAISFLGGNPYKNMLKSIFKKNSSKKETQQN